MGMTFNLGSTKGTATMRLKAWGIYNVTFKGIDYVEGTNKEGNPWRAMKPKFSSEEGIFEPLIFCPGDKGNERASGETNGKPWELPSALETLMFTASHLGEQLSPDRFEKMRKLTFELPEDFKKFVDTLNKVLEPAVNKQTKLKLIGNSKGYASLPSFVSIGKDGEAYISNNWLGDTVAFSDYEVKKMNEQKNAKPTAVKDDLEAPTSSDSSNADLDFDV